MTNPIPQTIDQLGVDSDLLHLMVSSIARIAQIELSVNPARMVVDLMRMRLTGERKVAIRDVISFLWCDLSLSPQGRQAILDFGFQPVFQEVERPCDAGNKNG